MMGELGKSQLSSLLETVPGLASVLRSPVADAIVNMIRAGALLRDFDIHDAEELVQYATRRSLIPSAEGAQLLDEVKAASRKSGAKKSAAKKPAAKKPAAKKPAAKKPAVKKPVKKAAKKVAKSPAKKKAGKKTAGKASKPRR
jgi:hypothetical protein